MDIVPDWWNMQYNNCNIILPNEEWNNHLNIFYLKYYIYNLSNIDFRLNDLLLDTKVLPTPFGNYQTNLSKVGT